MKKYRNIRNLNEFNYSDMIYHSSCDNYILSVQLYSTKSR